MQVVIAVAQNGQVNETAAPVIGSDWSGRRIP